MKPVLPEMTKAVGNRIACYFRAGAAPSTSIGMIKHVNAACLAGLVLYFLIIPGFLVMRNLRDPALREPGLPGFVWSLHQRLTPRLEDWARRRVASGVAAHLDLYDVPSTEWPIFTAVFYLWTTETLQAAWERDPTLAPVAPREYARDTIEAMIELVMDPNHHDWVRRHWGDDYWHKENVFFRSLVIAAITSHENLMGSGEYVVRLRDQVETLSAELDASRFGILNDYPGECYPIDVLAATAWIQRGGETCGVDTLAFVQRELRAFTGDRANKRGLVPYLADPRSGTELQSSRGIGNSHMCIYAPELWPRQAETWYAAYEEHFWQDTWWASGFREFPRDLVGHNWTYDVDAGPILAGFSPSGNAFGVAAARVNGRFDHAATLGAQVMTACWPLPDGTFLGTRILSDPVHAPYLGQVAMLYFFSREPAPGVTIRRGGRTPPLVALGYLFYFGGGGAVLLAVWRALRTWRKAPEPWQARWPRVQFRAWCGVMSGALLGLATGHSGAGIVALLLAQFLPRAAIPKIGRQAGGRACASN